MKCCEKAEHKKENLNHGITHIQLFKKRAIASLLLTLPVLALSETIQGWAGVTIQFAWQDPVLVLLSAIIYFYGGSPFLKGMLKETKNKKPGMMTLIGMAISVAFFYSLSTVVTGGKDFFWELATLIDVMLVGHWIEMKSVLGASRALEELVKLIPSVAHVKKNGEIVDKPTSSLAPGQVVLVKPGEQVPADGIVIEGESNVDESLLTGESKPVHKKTGSKVIGGSVNKNGSLLVKIEKTGEKTYLSQVISLVKKAQESKSKTQELADKAAGFLFYAAVGAGTVTFITWNAFQGGAQALERGVTVLVIACPHALGLAIPLVVAISTAITASRGVLVRNRKAFERLKDVRAIVFDKTGTLTVGQFGVTKIRSDIPEKELLQFAAAVEQNSEHVIAKAVLEYARDRKIKLPPVKRYKTLPGKGVTGIVKGKRVYVGGPELLKSLGLHPPKNGSTGTVAYVVIGEKVEGEIILSDSLRPEAKDAIKRLKAFGMKVYMITGDSKEVAEQVAREAGVDQAYSQVLPDQKAKIIKEIKKESGAIVMVGDGINDAPALVTADIGIAIGAGTHVAIESADVILVNNDLKNIPQIIQFSRAVYAKMVQNLWWAAGYNIIAIPLAAGVLYSYGVLLSPAVGAMLMSASTVIVALNARSIKKKRWFI